MTESKLVEQRGLEPLGAYRGSAVAGTNPDEMGILAENLNVNGGAISVGHPFEVL